MACLGREGKQGHDLTPQVSPQHLLSAWSVSTYERTGPTDGSGDFCWRQELATVATSSAATLPILDPAGRKSRGRRPPPLPLSPFCPPGGEGAAGTKSLPKLAGLGGGDGAQSALRGRDRLRASQADQGHPVHPLAGWSLLAAKAEAVLALGSWGRCSARKCGHSRDMRLVILL